jgi:hypothetical protein
VPRYTTKVRAKRIKLDYFKRLHPFRRWKLILTIGIPAVAAVWIGLVTVRDDLRLYSSGPVSTGHAMFGLECRRCHGPAGTSPMSVASTSPAPVAAASATAPASGFMLNVSDAACLSCHDGPAHNANQTFTPACGTCHIEHKGRGRLASVTDQRCTQCHADMKTKPGTSPVFERSIRSFPSGHPEFAISVKAGDSVRRVRLDQPSQLKDTAQIKLNHKVHLEPGLRGVDEVSTARGVTKTLAGGRLTCAYCHQPDDGQAYMAPVRFAKHCVACHPLDFDMRVPSAVVPHDTPRIVRAFLRDFFTTAVEECRVVPPAGAASGKAASADDGARRRCRALALVKGGDDQAARPRARGQGEESASDAPRGRLSRRADDEAEGGDRPRGRLGGRQSEGPGDLPSDRTTRPDDAAGSGGWIATQVADAESVFKRKCAFCHTVSLTPGRLPEVAATAIPARWLPHSRFDHRPHRPLGCAECHRAPRSTETTDVLLPSIKTCSDCHHQATAAARSSCVECHRHHDKALEREPDGPFAIRDLRPRRLDAGRREP